jgi:hypothetical protein
MESFIAKETTIVLAQHMYGFVQDGSLCPLIIFFLLKL